MELTNGKKEEILQIQVRTRVNGYGLDVNGEGYLYFDVPDLIKGLLVHAGMECKAEMTDKEIKKYLKAMKNGTIARQLQNEINVLKERVSTLKFENRFLKERNKKLSNEKYY